MRKNRLNGRNINGGAKATIDQLHRVDSIKLKARRRIAHKIVRAVEKACQKSGATFEGGEVRLGALAFRYASDLIQLIETRGLKQR